jgi:hypothetical protein
MAAVAIAVRNQLQNTFGLTADSCEVGFDGRPKTSAGEFYIAIHPMDWSGISGDWDLGESYQFGVTLTMRMGVAPLDRWGIAVWLGTTTLLPNVINDDGLDARVRRAIVAIHHNQVQIRQAASLLIDPTRNDLIVTPLQLIKPQMPQVRGPDWFSAPPPETEHQVAECGVSQTLIFGKCERCADVPNME